MFFESNICELFWTKSFQCGGLISKYVRHVAMQARLSYSLCIVLDLTELKVKSFRSQVSGCSHLTVLRCAKAQSPELIFAI